MIICKTCIDAIRSRGELVVIDEEFEEDEATEMSLDCEWCGDDSHYGLSSVHFPTTESILDLVY